MDTQENVLDDTKPAKRFSVDLAFEFKRNYARQVCKAEVRNISLTGALIKTELTLKPTEKINVYLSLSGRMRKVAATVVWVGDKGIGLRFQPFNNRDLQIVDDIIYYATEKTTSTRDLMDSILSKVA